MESGNSLSDLIKSIPLWSVLAAIWIVGIAAMLCLSIRKAVRFRRKLKFCNPVADERILEFIQAHKKETGVKKSVAVLECDFVHAPSVFGYFKPCILIPSQFIKHLDRDSMNAILLHEIYHIRCHDILANYIWLAAKALHWFNPLVWFACKWFEDDVEVCRDQKVVRKMNEEGALAYGKSLLKAARFSTLTTSAPSSVAALFENKCKLRQRIICLVKPRRKTKSSVVISALLAMLMIVACFTTACQPTPSEPFVQSKDNDSVAQAIESSSTEMHTYSAPESWQSEAHDEAKHIDLYVDAEVDVPTDTWGLYELVPSAITEEDLQAMLDAIVGDATIYGEQTIRSKEYLLEQITHLEAQKEEFERLLSEGGLSEDEKLAQEAAGKTGPQPTGEEGPSSISMLSEDDLKRNIESFTSMINEAKAALPTAPDEDTVVQHEFVLADMFKEDITEEQALESGFSYGNDGYNIMKSLSGTADLGRETPADIYIQLHNGKFSHFSIYFADYDDYEQSFGGNDELYTGQELFKCDIGVEEAAQIARDKVSEMGYGYLDIDTTYVSGMLDRQRKEGDKFPECFEFVFTRAMDGATATYAHGDGVCTEEKELALEYAPYWEPGEVTVYVDDSGVIGIRVGTLKSDVTRQAYGIELKDFEEIMDIFETQLFINNAYSGPGDWEKVLGREIRVKEIRLGYMPTAWKDHSGKIIFTPVWDFFGEEVVTFEEGIKGDLGAALDENNRFYMDLGSQSLLTINALDGTIMIRP